MWVSFEARKLLIMMKSNLPIFSWFLMVLKLLPNQKWQKFIFFPKNCIVLALVVRSMMHLGLILSMVWCGYTTLIFFFCMWISSFPSAICKRYYRFLHWLSQHLCKKSTSSARLLYGLWILFHFSTCLSLYHYHMVLIIVRFSKFWNQKVLRLSSFLRFFWCSWIFILILRSVHQCLQRSQLAFWQGLHWFCRSVSENWHFKNIESGVPATAQWDRRHLRSTWMQVQSPAQHSRLRIQHCSSANRLQQRLRSDPWPWNAIWHGAAQKEKRDQIFGSMNIECLSIYLESLNFFQQ